MEFKRLNNMTGSDPVMNRRITSIFLHDFESFKELFTALGEHKHLDQIKFALHKIKPSLVIFEMEDLITQYEEFLELAKKEDSLSKEKKKMDALIKETQVKINKVKIFLASL